VNPDCSFHLINKVGSTIITYIFSFFYNLVFSFEKIDYKKSKLRYRPARLYKFKKFVIF